MKRLLLSIVCVAALVLGAAACTPADVSKDAIRKTFPSSQHAKAIRVAHCESRLDPTAVSPGGGNWGLFQINTVHKGLVAKMGYSWTQIRDPYVNTKVALRIYQAAGNSWRPWGCRHA